MHSTRYMSRRRLLMSAGAFVGAQCLGSARAKMPTLAPRAVGISDFVFGVGAEDGNIIAMNGWTGKVEHRISSPIEIVTLMANRFADRLVGIDVHNRQIAIFQNPGMGGSYVAPIVHDADIAPDLFAFGLDGRHAVYADFGSGRIMLLDLTDGQIVRSFTGFEGIHDVRFSALTGALTISSLDRREVQCLDLHTGKVSSLVQITDPRGRGIDHMSQTLSGRTGIIIQPGEPYAKLVAVRKEGGEILRCIRLSGPPLRAFISSDNRHILLPSTQEPLVDIIDLNTYQRVKTLRTVGLIDKVHTDPLSRTIVGVASDVGAVVLFNMADLTVQTTLRLRSGAQLLALNEESGLAFVHGSVDDRLVHVVDVRGENDQKTLPFFELSQPLWVLTSTNALAACH